MAQRKKSNKKSSKCPEPFNTLLDLAQAATLDYIFYKRRQKNRGKRNKIDPYAATGIAMGMGKIKNTEDLIRFGGFLGAMGAFDDDDDPSWEYGDIGTSFQKPLNNQYAWRLNCQDGSKYGIYPEQYQTKAQYDFALRKAELEERERDAPQEQSSRSDPEDSTPKDVSKYAVRIYCRVSRLYNGKNEYYLSQTEDISIGSKVLVPDENGELIAGVVLSVEKHTDETAPIDAATAKYIVREDDSDV